MEPFNGYYNSNIGLTTDCDPTTENGQLFLAELALIDSTETYLGRFNKLMENCKIKEGLYDRRKGDHLTNKRAMSHDNLIGIFSMSYMYKTNHRFEIWKYMLKHLGVYNNNGKEWLPFNPGNYFIWGYMAESWLCWLFLPIYIINTIISSNKPLNNTSGKILNWVELYPVKDNNFIMRWLWSYYEERMKVQYGPFWLYELMKIYFGRESKDFPIRKILGF